MSEQDAFIQAVIEHPRNDTHRLVYADWLDEYGRPPEQARAEFIRIQCQLDEEWDWGPEHQRLHDRAGELLTEYGADWLKPLGLRPQEVEFRRGFVEAVELTAATFLKRAAT